MYCYSNVSQVDLCIKPYEINTNKNVSTYAMPIEFKQHQA